MKPEIARFASMPWSRRACLIPALLALLSLGELQGASALAKALTPGSPSSSQSAYLGGGLDEILRLEGDSDGNGTLESSYLPQYDQTGHLAALLDPTGKPVVRYAYSPSGDVTRTTIDPNAPRPTQLRIEGRTGIVVQFSEEISRDELEAALAASGIKVTRPANRNKAEIPLTLAPALERGPKARREWILTLGEEPAAGEQVELLLDKWSVMDGFLNHPQEDLRFAITWPTTSASSRHILEDTDAPRVDLVVAVDGHLEIELSEAPDEATLASAIRLNGQSHAVTLQPDGFTLRSDQPLPLGDHLLEIETSLRDRAGRPLEQRFDAAFTWDGTTPALGIFKAESDTTPTNLLRRSRADKDLIADLTGLNLGYQGQPYDPETGLYYFRNRYYDPELGRFITADPLGYVDGPSLYAAFGNDPVNGRDPLGLQTGGPPAAYRAQQYVVSGQAEQDIANAGRHGASFAASFVPGVGEAHDASQALTGHDAITGEELSSGQRLLAGTAALVPGVGRKLMDGLSQWLVKRSDSVKGWFGRQLDKLWPNPTVAPSTLARQDFPHQGGEFLDDFATTVPFEARAPRGSTGLDDALPRPSVPDPKLRNLVDNLYKGTTNPNRVGTGTTADAVWSELATGQATAGRFHIQKAEETARGLQRWLRNNPGASHSDRLVAQSLLDELQAALGSRP